MTNPLLDPRLLRCDIDYSAITPDHFKQAFEELVPASRAEHEQVCTSNELTFHALFDAASKSEQLLAVRSLLSHLVSVVETPELRELEQNWGPQIAELFQEQALDERLYQLIRAFKATDDFVSLSAIHQALVHKVLRSYERGGIHLPNDQKVRLAEISARSAELAQQYEANITDFTGQAVLVFTAESLAGLPERTLANLPEPTPGHREVSMVDGSFTDVLKYCTVDATRQAVYEARRDIGTRAPWDNRPVLKELAALEHEYARVLGYESHAHLAIEESMAGTPATVKEFVLRLASLSYPRAKQEAGELLAFGQALLQRDVQFHDRAFVREKRRQTAYATNSEVVRQYFPVKHVVAGMLRVLETLYQLRFELVDAAKVWHPDVQVYRAFDAATGAELGSIYMDLFKRKHKQSGAWMNPACNRHKDAQDSRLPVTYLVCNAPKDVGQEPTFEFNDIVTLFHETGHTLHNLLSEVDEEFFSGLNQVQHDAIELPSQFLENFCWDYSIVKELSAHSVTGEPLPEAEFNNLKAARQFLAAETMLQGARYSLLDLGLYSDPNADPVEVEATVSAQWRTRPADPAVIELADFPHIFGGGYAGGYYAYQWAEMLSADSFAALREQGATFLEQLGTAGQFRRSILASGGVRSMAENFRAFRGRDPKPEFLLADYGIDVAASAMAEA